MPGRGNRPSLAQGSAHLPKEVQEGKVMETRPIATGADGRPKRVSVYQTDFKYPFLRVEETLSPDGAEQKVVSQQVMVADHLMVRVTPGTDAAQLDQHLAQLGLSIRKRIPNSDYILVALPSADIATYDKALASLQSGSGPLLYAEPDYIAQANSDPVIPNDANFSQLWNLQNTGQTGGTPGADVKATQAWAVTTGSTTVVMGMIDTGIDLDHPDLAANIWTNGDEIPGNAEDDDANGYVDDTQGWNFVSDNNNPDDDNGHGSHTAGIAGAVGNNLVGVSGVAQTVRLMPLKFLNASGSGTYSDALEAILYATAQGVLLTSNSWGGGSFSMAMRDVIQAAHDADIGFIAASGNNGEDNDDIPAYPASFDVPNVITVGSTNHTDALSAFSNRGATTVDLAAPGEAVYSTTANGSYGTMSGTSMAAPHVSGACALLKAVNPAQSFGQIKQSIVTQVDVVPALIGKVSTGGRLNIERSLVPATAPLLVIDQVLLDDSADGNGDGILSPGESANVSVRVRNIGAYAAEEVTATLTLTAPPAEVTFTTSTQAIGEVGSNLTAEPANGWSIAAAADAATPAQLSFVLDVTDNAEHMWQLPFTVTLNTVSTVAGRVTELGSNDALEGATVTFTGPFVYTATTEADGTYEVSLVDGTYEAKASAAGFNVSAPQQVQTPPDHENVDFILGHADLQLSHTTLSATAIGDHTTTKTFTITNTGNLPLTYELKEAPDNTAQSHAAKARSASALWKDVPSLATTPRGPMEGFPTRPTIPVLSQDVGAQALWHTLPFEDGFETSQWNVNWWETNGPNNLREVVTDTAARGSQSLHLKNMGPEDGHFTGLHSEFQYGSSPGYIGFWVQPGAEDSATCYVVLTDVYFIWLFDWAWFFANTNGRFYINADVGGNQSFAYTANTWYHVELRNINWEDKVFDYYVDDTLIQARVPMRNPDFCYGLAYNIIYNYFNQAEAWWDDFKIYADAVNWLTLDHKTGTLAPGDIQVITATFDATGLAEGTYKAAIEVSSNAAVDDSALMPVTFTVEPNEPPVAQNQNVTGTEDTFKSIQLTGTDPDSAQLTARIHTFPERGQLYQTTDGVTAGAAVTVESPWVTNAQGYVLFKPNTDQSGSPYTTFEFTMRDTRTESEPATITVNVTPAPDAPKAYEDRGSVAPGSDAVILNVLANDFDSDGDSLQVQSATNGAKGTVEVNANNTVTYTASSLFTEGTDTFTYTASDGTATATAQVVVGRGLLRAGTWPTQGAGPTRNGHYPARYGNQPLSLRWTRQFTSLLNQSVLAGGKGFMTLRNGVASTEALAFDLQNGVTAWSNVQTAATSVNPPSLDETRMYFQRVEGGNSHLLGVDLTSGNLTWDTGFSANALTPAFRSPLITGDTIYAPTGPSTGLGGFNRSTGTMDFQVPLKEEQEWSATASPQGLLTFTGGTLRIHDPGNGSVLSSRSAITGFTDGQSNIAYAEGKAAFVYQSRLFMNRIQNHEISSGWERNDLSFVGIPAIANGKIYAQTQMPGALHVLDAETGATLTTVPLIFTPWEQPVVMEDTILVCGSAQFAIYSLTDYQLLQALPHGGLASVADGTIVLTDRFRNVMRGYTHMPLVTITSDPAPDGSSVLVTLQSSKPGTSIYFTTNGSSPTVNSLKLPSGGSFRLHRSATVTAAVFIDTASGVQAQASFLIADEGAPGIPDDWEAQHSSGAGFTANSDDDRDGMTALQEYVVGTDADVADKLKLNTQQDPVTGTQTLTWPSITDRFYVIDSSTDMKTWTVAMPATLGTGANMTWTDTAPGTPRRFYQLRVLLP